MAAVVADDHGFIDDFEEVSSFDVPQHWRKFTGNRLNRFRIVAFKRYKRLCRLSDDLV